MRTRALVPPCAAVALAAWIVAPPAGEAFSLLGHELSLSYRHVSVFDNFGDPQANDNTTPHPMFPGATGAELSIWKAIVEWGSLPHGDGSGDPTQANLGDGSANFDARWMGLAGSPGGTNDNTISVLGGCPGGLVSVLEAPFDDGWRMFLYDCWIWDDDPLGPPPSSGWLDIQGIVTHEYGHALGLGHSNVAGATMGLAVDQVAMRSIEPDDIAGIQAVYGVAAPNKPTITGVSVSGNTLTIQGTNFSPVNNEVWFTGAAVQGISSNGFTIVMQIPNAASPGDVLVKNAGNSHSNLSNAWPFDPPPGPCDPMTYCVAAPNSAGAGAAIGFSGSTSHIADDLLLTVTGGVPNEFGLFFYGPDVQQVPVGDGFLCIGPGATGLFRLPAVQMTAAGTAIFAVDYAAPPMDSGPGMILPGATWSLQFWYRDPGFGNFGFNFSDGLRIQFCP